MKKRDELTERQKQFCKEYMKDSNASQAALRAGYSPVSHDTQASQLMVKPHIKEEIKRLRDLQSARIEIKADEVLRELQILGHSDMRQIYDDNGCIKAVRDWPEEIAKAVASIEVTEEFERLPFDVHCASCSKLVTKVLTGYTKKVKFWDKNKSLEMMGRHKKLFTDKIEHSATLTLEQLVAGSEDPVDRAIEVKSE